MAIKLGSPLLVDPREEEGPYQYAAGMQPEVDSDKFLLYIAPATFWALFFSRHSAQQWALLQWTILGCWRYIRVRRTWKSVHLSWSSTQWREKLERSHSRSTAPAENPQPGRLNHFRKIRMIVMMKRRERRSKSMKMPSNVQFYGTI